MNRAGSKAVKLMRDQYLLFRNNDFIALNKPAGIETVAGKEPGGALRLIIESMALQSECPIPVNSLKADVSGVQLMSLNAPAGKLARSTIKNGKFWRCSYWGIVTGRIPGRVSSSIINIPLRYGVPATDGEPCITHWKVLKFTEGECGLSLVEFEPRTNVENQINIHCNVSLKTPLAIGHSLHLQSVSACLPGGDDVRIVAPPIGDFKNQLESLGLL